MNKAKDVPSYIAQAPKEIQPKLKTLRKIIKEAAPKAEEKISYGMAYYGYKGRLVYFGIFKNHIGLYLPGSIPKLFKDELKGYRTATATIQFPHDKKLPLPLIKRMIKARVKQNEEVKKNT